MKNKLKLFGIAVFTTIIFSLAACADGDKDDPDYNMIGMYEFSKNGEICEWVFTYSNYKVTGYGFTEAKNGTWSSSGNNVTISYSTSGGGAVSGSEVFTVQENGNRLTLTLKDKSAQLSNLLVSLGLPAKSVTLTKTYPTPTVEDFTISGTGTFIHDGNPKAVTITAEEGKTNGKITIKYNGGTTAPSAEGIYKVTIDVDAVTGWKAVNGLFVGTLGIYSPFTNMSDFNDFLDNLSDNTKDAPYIIKLNVNDLGEPMLDGSRIPVISNKNIYISLDFSGSSFQIIPSVAFSVFGLTSVILPNTVTDIGGFGHSGLTSITIPSSVTKIGYYAFSGCHSLTSVTFQGTIPSSGFNSDAFGTYGNSIGDLREKFYATDKTNGTPGTYTMSNGTWTKK
jgi:hypothetical protein